MASRGLVARVWMIWIVGLGSSGVLAQQLPEAHQSPESLPVEIALTSPLRIPGLFVTQDEFPGHTTVISAQDIAASGAASIPQLLSRFAGVSVMDTAGFGLGADGSVNLRGVVNSSRTNALVLVDGVRQNRVTGDEVHWQSIPLEQIQRIEIIRGGGSLIYGEGALAGLINITLKHGAERLLETEEGVELGSFGQRAYFVSARGNVSPISYGISYTRRDVGGYRENTDSRTTTVTTHLGVDLLPSMHLETNLLHSSDTSDFPGGITINQSEARRRQSGSFSGLIEDRTTQVALSNVWTLDGFALVTETFWRLRESDSDTGSRLATIAPSKGLSVRGSSDQDFGSAHHTLVSGIELLDEKASVGTRTAPPYSESNKASYGLFAEDTLRLFDRVSLATGVRFDKARFEEAITFPAYVGTLRFEGWSPKVALSVEVAKPLTCYASFARPFKSPNVDDFSAAVPTGFVGNLDLVPQQANDYEVGLRLRDGRLGQVDASWFYSKTDDEILFNDLPGNDQNQNFDTKRIGLESSFKPVLPIPRLTTTLTYTFTESEFRKGPFTDKTLPGVPEHRLTANVTYEILPNLVGWLDWWLVSDFYRINDFNNVLPGDNYGVLTAGLRYTLGPLSAHFVIENLTNEEYTTFQASNGVVVSTGENPAAPITVRGGVTLRF